ncbi:MAG: PAS domain-containing protein [Alphaproteobacteria bacterium]|nr:PAS domain-containing protein [Alphaproteobacteria bacterium]
MPTRQERLETLYQIKSRKLADLYWYWRGLREDGLLPSRESVRPEPIAALLNRLWLLDVERDPIRFRTRLSGTDLYESLGGEATGQYLAPERFGSNWDIIRQGHEAVVTTARPHFAASYFEPQDGGPGRVLVEVVLLPLARDGRNVDTLMGCQAITLEGASPHSVKPGLIRDQARVPIVLYAPLEEANLPPREPPLTPA